MKSNVAPFTVAVFITGVLALASFQGVGSVEMVGKEKQPSWNFGEGLKPGDYFEYKICDSLLRIPESPDVCYVMALDVVALLPGPQGNTWIMSAHADHRTRSVDFILQVSDSSFEMITDGSSIPYADSLERTLEWAMKFAPNHKPQPLVIGKSWGVIASDTVPETKLTVMQADSVQIGQEVLPTYKIGYSLIKDSFLQIKDGFPMPIKAVIYKPVSAFKDVPLAMTFELIRYANGVENCTPQIPITYAYSIPMSPGKSPAPNLPPETDLLVNLTGLDNAASKDTDPSGNEKYQLLDDLTNSSGNYSGIETEYFDETNFRDELKNSTTDQVLKDLYGKDYEKIITSFDKFIELLTNTTHRVKNQLDSVLP
ncbi:hypothetical protein QVH35_07105 [Candidatus Nitrosotenuis chungbukensis]|uniref:hypothetical protein n=1 Tax=Candidatus Nitrosotenuis chungbukensis TaxID=1353246 RepID=UPI0005B2B5A8|nr:hypothetical protein [Candidatus Nitrosotenuis chungbukensis]WKT57202.1 hypothetical protein QVH35_07105 [Candidatus Nitrosotenuis chungbukensis]